MKRSVAHTALLPKLLPDELRVRDADRAVEEPIT